MNIQWSSRTDRWNTPAYLIEMVRQVLEIIELDPASCEEANETVKAKRIITQQENGLTTPWIIDNQPVSIFLNPPGSKIGNKSKTGLFWHKLIELYNAKQLKHAIFLAFSIEAMQMTQNYANKSILDFPFCVPQKRIHFICPDDESKNAPSHSNVIVYIPGIIDNTKKFKEVFSNIGAVKE